MSEVVSLENKTFEKGFQKLLAQPLTRCCSWLSNRGRPMNSVSDVLLTELLSSFMDNNFIIIKTSNIKILQYIEDIYRQILGKFHYISFHVV